MATIIDALVVTLGLDATGFKKGHKDVKGGLDDTRKQSEQTAKDMEAAGKRAASFFGSIRTELLALVGVTLSVQGFKNFITGMTDNLQQLAVNSQSLDMSAKSLDGWQRAAEAAGSSAEKITGNLQAFQNLVTTFRGGGNVQGNPLLMALNGFSGATGAKFDLGTQSSEDIMRTIAANWGKLNKDAQRKFGADVGLDNQTQQALTNGNLVTDADRFAKMSRATEDATRKAQEFNRRLAEMKQNFSAASQVLYTALIPYVEKLIPLIERVGIWVATHGPEISKSLQDIATQINDIVGAVGGWENVLQALLIFVGGKWLLGITSALGGVRAAMVAISRVSMIAGLIELQKYAAILEKKYAWLTDNPVANALNNGLGADKTAEWGLQLRTWLKDKTGINLLHGDEPGADNGKANKPADNSSPRGIRNNNPGNLNFAGQAGATKEGGENGRFAVFESMRDGISALYKQIQLYFSRGVNTIESVVNKYAPADDNNNVQAYIKQLVGATGKQADEKLSGEDTETVFKLIRGIINHENGKGYVSDQDILSGIQVGSTATAMRQQTMQQQSGPKTDIHIGEVSLQTSATTATALGSDIQRAATRQGIVSAYNTGQK